MRNASTQRDCRVIAIHLSSIVSESSLSAIGWRPQLRLVSVAAPGARCVLRLRTRHAQLDALWRALRSGRSEVPADHCSTSSLVVEPRDARETSLIPFG